MKIIDSKKDYKAPRAEVIKVNVRSMLCQSVNGPMYEKEFGDGGFHTL